MEAPAAIPPPENRPQSSRSPENRTSRSTDNVSSAHRLSEKRSPSVRMTENRPSEQRFSGSPEDRKSRSAEDVSPPYHSPENRSPSLRVPEGQPPEEMFAGSPEFLNQGSMEYVSTAYRSPENPSPSLRVPENRPSEQRFPGSPEYRHQRSTENVTMAYRFPESRPAELRFSALPEDQIQGPTAYRLPEKKPPPAIEDHPANRDDLALSPVLAVNRSSRVEMGSVVKLDEGSDRRSRVVSSILLRSRMQAMVRKSELWLRILGMIFCLVSFSVMAADKTQGWSGDSFERYKAYRFCISVTIIGFVYAGFQAYGQAHHLITGKHLIRYPLHCYFDFSMDQIFAYLLMSASSAAATRTDDWVINWGHDEFTKMASASIGMAFLAFVTFAFSALISGYNLCNQNPLPQL